MNTVLRQHCIKAKQSKTNGVYISGTVVLTIKIAYRKTTTKQLVVVKVDRCLEPEAPSRRPAWGMYESSMSCHQSN